MMTRSTTIDGIDYGPLAALVGTWEGEKGVDIAPEPDGEERNLYYEKILYEAIGDVTNAEKQTLSVLRYHQVVRRKSNSKVFHNETGYWSYDGSTGILMHSLTIPRGLALLAGGSAETGDDGTIEITVTASVENEEWGITQSPFMQKNARTTAFSHRISVNGDEMNYDETTVVEIYGKTFEHTDRNRLTRTVA